MTLHTTLRISLLGLALTILLSNVLVAQGVSVAGDNVQLSGFGEVDAEKTVQHWVDQEKQRMSSELGLRVDRIAEVCQLEESETKKLRLAVKGIVSKRINAGRLQLQKFVFASGLVDEDPEIDQEFEKKDKLNFYGGSRAVEGVVEFRTYFSVPMMDHPLWQKTLEKSLTDEKLKLYSDYRVAANTRVLRHAVDHWVTDFNSKVILTEQQATSIANHMTNKLVPDVTPVFPRTIRQASKIIESSFGPADSLNELLNQKQIELRESAAKARSASVGWGGGPPR